MKSRTATFFLLIATFIYALPVAGDALMRSQAVSAGSIAQYYIDEEGVRLELEIGLESIEVFKNLLPDGIFEQLGYGSSPLAERLQVFFSEEMALVADGQPLAGYVSKIGPSRRVLRDPVNGTPLAIQDDAPEVISAILVYPFEQASLPGELVILAGSARDLGFVAYHKGVAVNDYRFLSSGYTLNLDWEDPWYSSFTTRNLTRRYSEPMSGFIYVENFEVRKEIIVRPKDLQRWVDLGLEGRETIPITMQADIKQQVGQFLSQHHAVTIDGELQQGILDSVNFLERTLTSSRVIDPPEELALDSAVMGAIFVYPRNGLPQKVVMDWDLWDERIQRIPVSAVDQAGPLPSYLEPDWAQLEWTNFLKNPDVPTLAEVELPVESWRTLLERVLPLLVALAIIAIAWAAVSLVRRKPLILPVSFAVLLVCASVAALRIGGNNQPDEQRANAIVGDLLHNVYRAFDHREESDIYDVLARSVSGELLTDIFLETKRSLVLANQGGAQAKVKNIVLEAVQVKSDDDDDHFTVEADWTVHGSVGHWGHIHQRSNRYLALLRVGVDDNQWKLQEMKVLQEERL